MAFPTSPTDLQMFGEYYYDLAVSAWRVNNRFPTSLSDPQDLTLDGTSIHKEVIVCKNLTTTSNTSLRTRSVWVWGDATINHTITFSPVISWYSYTGETTGPYIYIPGKSGSRNGMGGQGCLGGAKAANSGFSGGGGSAWHPGGSGSGPGGAAGGNYPSYSFGGPGGNSGTSAGGSGAGPGAGPGTPNPTAGDMTSESEGGELVFIIVRGNLTINSGAALSAPGGVSARINYSSTYRASGCAGGGVLVVAAMNGYQNNGQIIAAGGSTGNYQSSGGGGGHVEVYAPTSTFGTISAPGGTGPSGNGGAGTTASQNTSISPTRILIDPDMMLYDGFWFRFLKGHYSY